MNIDIIKKYIFYAYDLTQKNNVDLYIVGGFLRDYFCKKDTYDIDFIVSNKTKLIAELFVKKFRGAFVVLDEDNKIYRVVKNIEDRIYNFDFGQMRGLNLHDDLKQRDFSVNALAWKVNKNLDFEKVIDFTNGLKDLENKKISVISKEAFKEDPLRLIRAYRLAGQYNFSIDNKTEIAINENKNFLPNVSRERVHDELLKIFSLKNSFKYVLNMNKSGLLEVMFPEINLLKDKNDYYFHPQGLWGHSLEILYCFERIVDNLDSLFDKEKSSLMKKYLETDNNLACLKIVCLFHDIGKPECFSMTNEKVRFFGHDRLSGKYMERIAKELKFSNKDVSYMKHCAEYHMDAGNLAKVDPITDRACYRYFKRMKEFAIAVLVFTMADWLGSIRGAENIDYSTQITNKDYKYKDFIKCREAVARILEWFIEEQKVSKTKKIINGNDIKKKFKLKQGPIIGKILDALEEAQVDTNIKTKSDAFDFVKAWLELYGKENNNLQKK
jgi:poly(A) polymerase